MLPLYGRDWAFLAEFAPDRTVSLDQMLTRLWTPVPENMEILARGRFGPLFRAMGLESARCYLEHAQANQRTVWAMGLSQALEQLRGKNPASAET